MEEYKAPNWSSDESQLLRHEAFVAEVIKRRSHPEGSSSKPWWQRFLETSGGTALITVLLGGLLGQIITWSVQNSLKQREFQQAWMKARGDQALLTYNEYLSQEREIVKRVYELVGNSISAAEDLIALTGPEFALGGYEGVEKQRATIRKRYNSIDQEWRTEREKLGLLMSYYHHGRPEVVATWRIVQAAVTKYSDCGQQWYLNHPDPAGTEDVCKSEKEDLRRALDQLGTSLEAARQYAWEGWESPDKLKSVLERQR